MRDMHAPQKVVHTPQDYLLSIPHDHMPKIFLYETSSSTLSVTM